MRNLYFGYQLNMADSNKSISDALKRYYDRFGLPPQIVLVSDQLEDVQLPAELHLVVKVQRVPKNILMIGNEE